MAKSSNSEKKASKKYYDTHPKYREKKKKKQIAKQKANPKKYAEIDHKRYHTDSEYRKYRKNYNKKYYRTHKGKWKNNSN